MPSIHVLTSVSVPAPSGSSAQQYRLFDKDVKKDEKRFENLYSELTSIHKYSFRLFFFNPLSLGGTSCVGGEGHGCLVYIKYTWSIGNCALGAIYLPHRPAAHYWPLTFNIKACISLYTRTPGVNAVMLILLQWFGLVKWYGACSSWDPPLWTLIFFFSFFLSFTWQTVYALRNGKACLSILSLNKSLLSYTRGSIPESAV